LERRLFPVPDAGTSERCAIDWAAIQRELKRRGVTLALLWQEYLADHPNGYSYTRFCELYGAWRKQVSPTMRQTHLAGEKLCWPDSRSPWITARLRPPAHQGDLAAHHRRG
jgi:transposase